MANFSPTALPLAPNHFEASTRLSALTTQRLWRGFLTARLMIALAILLLQGLTLWVAQTPSLPLLTLSSAYFVATIASRWLLVQQLPPPVLGLQWLPTLGLDLVFFALLQWPLFSNNLNYSPLLAVPVLMAAALGAQQLSLATTALTVCILLTQAIRDWENSSSSDTATSLTQIGLLGISYFVLGLMVNNLARHLAQEEHQSENNRLAAELQAQVNNLVIESLPDGILVVDVQEKIRAINPSGKILLNVSSHSSDKALNHQKNQNQTNEENQNDSLISEADFLATHFLSTYSFWQPLQELVRASFSSGVEQTSELSLHPEGQSPIYLHVRTRLTCMESPAQGVCVVFLHDLREMQARLRTEKLAAMGRMSAAVAHEIRNPLAAISQANSLLSEELESPIQQKLSSMIEQNALRLERIVDDVLDVSRVETRPPAGLIDLDDYVKQICVDWIEQAPDKRQVILDLQAQGFAASLASHKKSNSIANSRYVTKANHQNDDKNKNQHSADASEATSLFAQVIFDVDHLRRIVINLLDNALRYQKSYSDSLQVSTLVATNGQVSLQVWSDGEPLEQGVERHLFEPFFSSESRSSGLGLYICRQLCEQHQAYISYLRCPRPTARGLIQGNAFTLYFYNRRQPQTTLHHSLDSIVI